MQNKPDDGSNTQVKSLKDALMEQSQPARGRPPIRTPFRVQVRLAHEKEFSGPLNARELDEWLGANVLSNLEIS